MPIRTTADAQLVKTFHSERERQKLDDHIELSTIELAQAQADLRAARKLADLAAVEESDARRERERLTRQYAEDVRATDRIIGEARVAQNHVIAMSHEERRARGQLQIARERLEEWT